MNFTQADYEKLQILPSGAYWKMVLAISDPTLSDKCASPCTYIFTARDRDGKPLPYQAIFTFAKSGNRNVGKARYHSALAPERSFMTVEKMLSASRSNGKRKSNTKHNAPVDILAIPTV